MPALSQHHRVYALDLLGFGASRKVFTRLSVDLWVQQIRDFWQTFIREPVVLVGNSLGSLVALAAAGTYSEMVQGLAMINLPDVSRRQKTIPKILQPLVRSWEHLFTTPLLIKPLFLLLRRPQVIRRWVSIAYYDQKAVTDELVAIIANPPQDEAAARAFCALCQTVNQPQFAPSAEAILSKLEIPLLLVWGCQDRMVPASLAPVLAGVNPLIELVMLEQAGHCPHDECPERFNPVLLTWLKKHFDQT
jgi:pimeloyl-ACP methyl ester carboxylesterase